MADIVLLATADWDHPLWTNKQHVACSLAKEGHSILYVESLGLRSANATSKDLRRIFNRLIKGLSPPKRVAQNIWVYSPLVVPGASAGVLIGLNRLMIRFGINLALKIVGLRCEWLWTYNPMTMRFLNIKDFLITIYHAVDAIQEQPNMPKNIIELEEKRLCNASNYVFATSPAIYKSLKSHSKRIKYYPNCCDYNHFSKALEISRESIPNDLFRLATAYNAGPGNLRNWQAKVNYNDDPLMYIESIPSRETRSLGAESLNFIAASKVCPPASSLPSELAFNLSTASLVSLAL